MKTLFVFLSIVPVLSFATVHPTSSAESDAANDFSGHYVEWTALLISKPMPPEALRGDPSSFFYDNKSFANIVALGPPVLPDILVAGRTNSIVLEAFHRITKWSYRLVRTGSDGISFEWHVEGHPETKTTARKSHAPPRRWTICALWWTDWRFQVEGDFRKLEAERTTALSRGDIVTATNALRRIRDLGLPVLAFLVEEYPRTPEYLPLISDLTGEPFPPGTPPRRLEAWWRENKARYELPSKEETPAIEIPPFE